MKEREVKKNIGRLRSYYMWESLEVQLLESGIDIPPGGVDRMKEYVLEGRLFDSIIRSNTYQNDLPLALVTNFRDLFVVIPNEEPWAGSKTWIPSDAVLLDLDVHMYEALSRISLCEIGKKRLVPRIDEAIFDKDTMQSLMLLYNKKREDLRTCEEDINEYILSESKKKSRLLATALDKVIPTTWKF